MRRELFNGTNGKALAGMTLVEIIVVISIITILLGVGTYSGVTARNRAKISKAKNELRLYGTAVVQYHNEHATDPDLSARWPKEIDSATSMAAKSCDTDGNGAIEGEEKYLFETPPELLNSGLLKGDIGKCSYYDYDNFPAPDGVKNTYEYYPHHVIDLVWTGLDRVKYYNGSPQTMDKGDNVALMILGDWCTDVVAGGSHDGPWVNNVSEVMSMSGSVNKQCP